MGLSINEGTQQPLVFLLDMIILGGLLGTPLMDIPIYHQNTDVLTTIIDYWLSDAIVILQQLIYGMK